MPSSQKQTTIIYWSSKKQAALTYLLNILQGSIYSNKLQGLMGLIGFLKRNSKFEDKAPTPKTHLISLIFGTLAVEVLIVFEFPLQMVFPFSILSR